MTGTRANPDERPDGAEATTGPPAGPAEDWPEGGEGGTPSLTLDGFTGPLDRLLALARGQKIDLTTVSLAGLVDQLTAAMQHASATIPLGQKGDWVVMAAWLLQLRSILLLPADALAKPDAAVDADQLRGRLIALEDIQALAGWLERRPQLGCDVFARGQPELFGVSVDAGPAIDAIEFLWASLALFDDATAPETVPRYQPRPFDFYAVVDARDRIRRRLSEISDGASLEWFLPGPFESPESAAQANLRRRSAWSSTLMASLELARQGEIVMEQRGSFEVIHLAQAEGPVVTEPKVPFATR